MSVRAAPPRPSSRPQGEFATFCRAWRMIPRLGGCVSVVLADPEGFAVDWDWQPGAGGGGAAGASGWGLARRRVPGLASVKGSWTTGSRPGRPAKAGHGAPHAAG